MYHFEIGDSKLSLNSKKCDVLDPFTQKTYPGDSALGKFPQKVKFDETVKMVKFT